MARLDEIFDLQMGKTPSRNNADYWTDCQYDWVSIADLGIYQKYVEDTKERISALAVQESGIKSVPANTVIMSFKLSLGKTAITQEPVYTNEAIMAFIPTGKYAVLPDYFYYLFSAKDWTKGTNRAVMGTTLNKATLGAVSITVPPIDEQRKIAAILDKVSDLIAKRRQQLDTLDELVKSRFIEMFGVYKELKRLETYATLITKGASPKWQGVDYCKEGTLFVTSENVREGYLDLSKRKYLDDKINEIQPRSMLKRNDILINIVGASIGRAAIYNCDELANINQAVALVRVNYAQINQTYLITYLNSSQALEMYSKMKKGGARDNLSLQNIAALQIPVAPMEVQNQFAAFVAQTDKSKLAIQKSLEKLEILKKALMQEYFG